MTNNDKHILPFPGALEALGLAVNRPLTETEALQLGVADLQPSDVRSLPSFRLAALARQDALIAAYLEPAAEWMRLNSLVDTCVYYRDHDARM